MVHPILPHLLQRLVSKPQGLKRYAARAKIAACNIYFFTPILFHDRGLSL
ncbi:hypothetical protein F9C07_12282 [Aspergillus flavus]|uniref:Uncharacterized protein n=1 Tax=Aspergillus flavus (strain ATCC 200026 / FGSC A1120 / IAM 13836 / NRRL 3357 / JCM 12722 / SRRC 167) TaxID=332952 RepID=A0A7U2R1U9_ASPFN|nr:hypothetical protein F9C07_12282 [Aspergillus flavus]